MDVSIIGGAGHVGLPLGLVLADSGHDVTLVDTDCDKLETIRQGTLPFYEPGAEALLQSALETGRLTCTDRMDAVRDSSAVVFVLGTPIDEHHNPQMEGLLEVVDESVPHLSPGDLLVFRSTVYPGMTHRVRDLLADRGLTVGEDVYLSFAPERIAQHKAIEEIRSLPQLVGAFDDESYERTVELFDSVVDRCLRLTPTEAELGKLFTNMWRYLTFAAANEFHLIAESFAKQYDVNIHRILDTTSEDYPRFDVPSPGANVGGPCLTKDGWFLIDNIPYNELVSASYQINEGMPAQIVNRMLDMRPGPEKIAVLGMTFKANSDDTRNSVSFKMRKQLRMRGFERVVEVEPNVEGYDSLADIEDSDWVILMTPHDEFRDFDRITDLVGNDDCLYCDLWGAWEPMRYDSANGYFYGYEYEEVTAR
ncbi:nucleotide sugar dehydrogenase [Halopiger goleimassiliensis]|uniref:nucleotide sugar dehydrogenase n=1 Tax=Halopiger goleimassiliensis TaxID=1293048 RepID=UPI0009DBB9A4|nr:nucleotide sugar dehydrogenase [Halopiger goleimassiliensis]